jgi:cytochrome c biogenesis protein CcmG, thiol:disulfide interchange protein DsbE
VRRAHQLYLIMLAALILASLPLARADSDLGQPAPALVVEELNGKTFDLAAQRGKVTIVNFWATWCPPCRKEMPALSAFYRHYHGRGLEMIAVSADRPHDRSDVTKMAQSFSYPAAMLDDAQSNGFGDPSALPVTYVVDANGIVRAKLTPDEKPVTEQSLAATVLPLLPERKDAPSSTQ